MTTPVQNPQQPAPQPTYPHQPPYAGQPWPAQPPKKKGMPAWAIVLIVIAGVTVLACVGGVALIGIGAKSVSDGNKAAMKDVSLSSCGADGGSPNAGVDITNHGSSAASYSVTVEFVSKDGGTQIGTGTALVNDLGPGQTTHTDANSLQFNSPYSSDYFQCKITKVNRF